MFAKGTKLYSVIHQKCPRCQEGDLFKYGTFSPRFSVMNKTCSACGLDFNPEPQYYFGAMYFSYAAQVGVFVGVYLLLRFTIDPPWWTYVLWVTLGSIAVLPINFRWSRLAWINLFFTYRPNEVTK